VTVLVAALVGVGVLALVALRPGGDDAPPGPGGARVVRVVDGDTLVVRLGGTEETVRVLGIDTPETHHPDKPVECYGPEASARMAELLPAGTAVRLERDVELHDTFGRLLAHVVRLPDGERVGLTLVEEGYADTLRIPPNTSLSGELAAARDRARDAGLGLWGACG
jgi:micrococcal nuclease